MKHLTKIYEAGISVKCLMKINYGTQKIITEVLKKQQHIKIHKYFSKFGNKPSLHQKCLKN